MKDKALAVLDNCKADTTLHGEFNRILPLLYGAGWDFDYIKTNSKGHELYKYGVLFRDIPNPVYKGDKGKSYPHFSSRYTQKLKAGSSTEPLEPLRQAVSEDISGSGSKFSGWNGAEADTEKAQNGVNPQYRQVSLFPSYPQFSSFDPKLEKSAVNTETPKPASRGDLGSAKNDGFENHYGRIGCPTDGFEPDGDGGLFSKSLADVGKDLVVRLSDIPTISNMRSDDASVTVAIDTEYCSVGDDRYILTWQFAFSDTNPHVIHEVVFFSVDGSRLPLGTALCWIVDRYRLYRLSFVRQGKNGCLLKDARRWAVPVSDGKGGYGNVVCRSYEEAVSVCDDEGYRDRLVSSTKKTANGKNLYHKMDMSKDGDVGYYNGFEDYNHLSIPFTLLFHAGIADLTGFGFVDFDSDILTHVSSVSGGLVSLKSFFVYPIVTGKPWYFRPMRFSVRDTMCFAPDKKRSLEILGQAVGVPKIALPKGYGKDDMCRFLLERPVDFIDYAVNDAVVTLCYASELWDYNVAMPVTISSASAKACLPILKEYFGCGDDDMDEFNRRFRGLKKEGQGLVRKALGKTGKLRYGEYSSLVPVNDDANLLQTYAKNAFKGGYNASVDIGWYDKGLTYDYDLKNAYATSMALCYDIDWGNERVIYREWKNEKMSWLDFRSPYDPIFGYFQFEFPESVKYPCIPVTVDGSIVYPRKYLGENDRDGVYACGPEIYLALRLGAKVTAIRAVQGMYRINEDSTVSHSFLSVAKGFIRDRNVAKEVFGEGSLAEVLIKTALNCIYGKTAQGIVEKKSWDAYTELMEKVGGSDITSPTHASIITSGIRACLLATMNQLAGLGYRVYSVTTDGLITDAPFDVLKNLDLYGFANVFRTARMAMTGTPEMWQVKHVQKELLNFTTRGNVAPNTMDNPVVVDGVGYAGVCAHNGYVTGEEPDSYADRLGLMTTVLSREGRCRCNRKVFASFREVARRADRKDFSVENEDVYISMDFDLKRKPVHSSFGTVYPVIGDRRYEIANFATEPYEDIEEYRRYKNVGQNHIRNGCLLTGNDWDLFFLKLEGKDCKDVDATVNRRQMRHVSDIEWARIMTVVMGHRLGYWVVPYLDEEHALKEKLDYINAHNKSKKRFGESDWKNSRKMERASQMLPKDMVLDLLSEVGAYEIEAENICGRNHQDDIGKYVLGSRIRMDDKSRKTAL